MTRPGETRTEGTSMDQALTNYGITVADVYDIWKDRKAASGAIVLVRFGRNRYFTFAGDAGILVHMLDTFQVDTNFLRNSTTMGYRTLDDSHMLCLDIAGEDKAKDFVWGLVTHGYSAFVYDLGV